MKENKEFYITIQVKKIVVTEEVYRAYVRPIRTEQRRKRRAWKCRVVGAKGNLVRCKRKCSECEYANSGRKATGNVLSLDKLLEDGVEIRDKHLTPEEAYLEKERLAIIQREVNRAIFQLRPRQQEMLRLIYFEEKKKREVAEYYGITPQAVHSALNRILRKLRKILNNFL